MDSNSLLDIRFTNIVSNCIDCLFSLLIVSFAVQDFCFFQFDVTPLIIFLFTFVACAFGVELKKKKIAKTNVKEIILYFTSRNFMFLGFRFKFNSFYIDFCVWCNIRVQCYSFVCEYSVFPTLFTKIYYSFPIGYSWYFC